MPNTDSGRFNLLDGHERRICALEKDMWHGNGKPGITTRVALMEESLKKLNNNLSKIVWLMVATLASVLVKLFILKG